MYWRDNIRRHRDDDVDSFNNPMAIVATIVLAAKLLSQKFLYVMHGQELTYEGPGLISLA